jgi:hypothetical protein
LRMGGRSRTSHQESLSGPHAVQCLHDVCVALLPRVSVAQHIVTNAR